MEQLLELLASRLQLRQDTVPTTATTSRRHRSGRGARRKPTGHPDDDRQAPSLPVAQRSSPSPSPRSSSSSSVQVHHHHHHHHRHRQARHRAQRDHRASSRPRAHEDTTTATNSTRPKLAKLAISSKPRAPAPRHKRSPLSQLVRASSCLLVLASLLVANRPDVDDHSYTYGHRLLAHAFNVDSQAALVYSGPTGSYFGYSVAQHRDQNTNWLLVGAPKAQTDQPATRQTGAVYRCTPNNSKGCQQVPFDANGSSAITLRGEKFQSDDKSLQWFGASLQSAIDNGSIVACAPRYVYYTTNLKRRDPVGTCWLSRGSFSGFVEYSPCRLNDQWGHHHLGSCQAGFSSAITRDGSRLFMGAPGAHVWQGQVFGKNLKTELTNSTSWVNPHSEDDSYLGYSLALGRFSGQPSSAAAAEVDLAIGIPRGHDLAGKVMLVDRELRPLRNITGEQLGSYFGYALATADVNGDGLDDLLIGAPLYYNQTNSHKEPHFDRGRVYVALQSRPAAGGRGHEFALSQRLDGHRNQARFGTALANCGDLNRDGYQDVAVGAPYDGPNQHGAVYIYLGSRAGLAPDPSQVIYAESVRDAGLRSFGFSLAGGLDLDANHYPDLLVGDYEADRAVLLRARPVVNMTTSISFQPENFNLDDKSCLLPNSSTPVSCITVQYCSRYTGFQVDNKMSFLYDIKLDSEPSSNRGAPRLFFLNHPEAANKNELRQVPVLLTKDVQKCQSFKAYIVQQIRDKLTPLRVDIDYQLTGEQSEPSQPALFDYTTGFPKLRPILNRLQPNRMTKSASIQKNCGPDNVCVPDLKLTVNPNMDQYTIGSNERLVLDVTVKNYGEDAFESMFYLHMPTTIDFNTYNKSRQADYPICYKAADQEAAAAAGAGAAAGANVLACDLGNPMQRNEVVKFSVITEPAAQGQFSSPDFTFVALVNSTNPEQDERRREDNQVEIGIPIRVEVQLVLSGSSQPPLVLHNSTRHQQQQSLSSFSTSSGFLGGFLSSGTGSQYVNDEQQQQPALATMTTVSQDAQATQPVPQAKLSEADVGPEVYHIYHLQNKGPSTISDIALSILWPTRTSDGKYLLYLVDEPSSSSGKVRCQPAPEDAINPLNLKYLKGNSINVGAAGASSAALVAAPTATGTATTTAATSTSLGTSVASGDEGPATATRSLYRRQAEPQPPTALAQRSGAAAAAATTTSTVDNSVLQQLNWPTCGPTQCTRFECNVMDLAHNELVTIKVRSRLYEDTIDALSMQEFDISSKLVAQVKSLPYNVSTHTMPPYAYKVETQVHTTGLAVQDLLPWWLIVLAILLGVLLFGLLACFLKYLGFFSRKRPPTTKGAEKEPLTPTMWNDYQYTPGDTAL